MVTEFTDFRQPEQYMWFPHSGDALTDAQSIVDKAAVLHGELEAERLRLEVIDRWYRGRQSSPSVPDDTKEMQRLLDLSRTPWLGLVVSTVAQTLFVDGYKSSDGKVVQSGWDSWLANGMPKHQTALHRAALGYGYSFALAESGVRRDGESQAVIKCLSPKKCYAVYEDPAIDEWPVYAIRVGRLSDASERVWFYDSTFRHTLELSSGKWSIVETVPHGAPQVPIVRYTNMCDLDGNTPGEVEPFIGIAQRIDKTTFDRLLVQHYNSWKKIWIAGLKKPDGMEAKQMQQRLRQQDTLNFEDVDTRVGTLDETSIEGFIGALERDVEDIAVLSQLNHLLTGRLANLSADTLATANKPFTQKVFERKVSFGDSHNQLMRLVAHLDGDLELSTDFAAHVSWQDTEVRSLSQAADALGKFAESLGIPKRALWRMVPDITESDAQEWEAMAVADDPIDRLLAARDAAPRPRPLDAIDDGDDDEDSD